MRTFIILCLASLVFSGCTAMGFLIGSTIKQEKQLNELEPGSDVYITAVNGNLIEGEYNGENNNNLYLTIEDQQWAIPQDEIESIEVPDVKWRFIGAAIGISMDVAFLGLVMSSDPILGDSFRMSY